MQDTYTLQRNISIGKADSYLEPMLLTGCSRLTFVNAEVNNKNACIPTYVESNSSHCKTMIHPKVHLICVLLWEGK
jgi:hypothetical protein